MKEWDIFLSHASEDKAGAAVPLADALERAGIRVWFDDRQLRIGDSIREKVEEGLSRSRYGAVILSPSFVAKQWPRRELNALFALEEGGRPLILPVWHKIDRAAVLSYSPILADRLAANTNDGFERVAQSISAVILSDPASPVAREPGLQRRLLSLLGDGADPHAVKAFLLSHPQILGYVLAGGSPRVQVRGDGLAMIDEDWLRGLRVTGPDGVIHGFLGIGTEWVVLKCTHADGTASALSFRRNHLGFHISEVSHLLTDTPGYDLGRVNRKLRQLTGAGGADLIIEPYDRLYSKIIFLLADGGIAKVLSEARSSMGTVIATMAIPFIRQPPPSGGGWRILRRLMPGQTARSRSP